MPIAVLFGWMAIAAILRFTHLSTKPLWADEISTLVFSLGNSFRTIPLDQGVSWQTLLQPLQPNSTATASTVIQHLLTESNHPPLYFALSHWWLAGFAPESGLVSLGAARSLSALFGVLAVPAIAGLGWLTTRSGRVAQVAAGLMAVSPLGIYLAQEARHYTLAVLWILASLACLVHCAQTLCRDRPPAVWLCGLWIVVNGLGIATHYFVMLALAAQAIALGGWLFWHVRIHQIRWRWTYAGRLGGVALGTAATAVVWLPILANIRGSELARWIESGEFDRSTAIDQVLRAIAGLISHLYLVPIQDVPLGMVIGGAIVLVLVLGVTLSWLWQGGRRALQSADLAPMFSLIGGVGLASLGLAFFLTFGLGVNFTSVFRYQFIHFPAVLLTVAIALAAGLPDPTPPWLGMKTGSIPRQSAIAIVLLCGFIGGITVTQDWAYQRVHRPDRVAAAVVQQSPPTPTLLAIPHKTHAHSSRLMAIAWELQRLSPAHAAQSQFLLAGYSGDQVETAIAALQAALTQAPRPLTVWRINFRSQANPLSHAVLTQAGCAPVERLRSVDGYRYQPYTCP